MATASILLLRGGGSLAGRALGTVVLSGTGRSLCGTVPGGTGVVAGGSVRSVV